MIKLLAALGSVALGVLVLPAFVRPAASHAPERQRAAATGAQLAQAMTNYFKEYGVWLAGPHADMIAALRGANPKQRVFLKVSPQALNARGELTDPWGTPYRVTVIAASGRTQVHSAGPDGVFDHAGARTDDQIATSGVDGAGGLPGLPF